MILRIVLLIIFLPFFSIAQNSAWIFLKDKNGISFNPYLYFDQKAIDRRLIHNIPLNDYTDLPVNDNYISVISVKCNEVLFASRWFNAIAVIASDEQLNDIRRLEFVLSVEKSYTASYPCSTFQNSDLIKEEKNLLIRQTERMGVGLFKLKGITGKGVRVAIFDAGFPGVDVLPAFDHIRKRNGIIATYDFVTKKDFVFAHSEHGTEVMSCIGGMADTINIGLATGCDFLLARTEDSRKEPFSEEVNWLAAAEWADKNGAQIINSSLGYTDARYFPSQMDGKTTLVARAANMAARKGILVVNAAGNDGSGNWKKLGTPADADSVLTVGGINPETDFHAEFSSYGPTADFRRKPNVSAFGYVMAATPKGLGKAQGTSFASPLVAGFSACVLEINPGLKNMELFRAVEQSGDLYPYYDYAHGYGIPQASYFTDNNASSKTPTFNVNINQSQLEIKIAPDLLIKNGLYNLIYYNIQNTKGYLSKYAVLDVTNETPFKIDLKTLTIGDCINIHFRNYTYKYVQP